LNQTPRWKTISVQHLQNLEWWLGWAFPAKPAVVPGYIPERPSMNQGVSGGEKHLSDM
jgi:hypothetical protein